MIRALYATYRAIRYGGWQEDWIVGLLDGPCRHPNGGPVAWCHHCDKPVLPGEEIMPPPEEGTDGYGGTPIYIPLCPRCLRAPED